MQTVNTSSVILNRQIMKNHSYKMEQNDNSVTTDADYDSIELTSKSGDSLLISLVQNYPHLYVKTSKNQKDDSLRDKSWQEIASILEQPASECLKRWTRLRERYSKAKRLSEQNLRNGTVNNRQSWPHYVEMGFLAQHIVGRRSYRNIHSRIKRPRYEKMCGDETPSPPEQQSLSPSPTPNKIPSLVSSPAPSPSTSAIIPSPDMLFPAKSERGRFFENCIQNIKPPVNNVEESIPEGISSSVFTQSTNNNNTHNQHMETSEDLFCKYIASELKKMPENDKKATIRRLMDALYQENT